MNIKATSHISINKRIRRALLSALVIVALVTTSIAVMPPDEAHAAAVTYSNFTYEYKTSGTYGPGVYITNYTGTATSLSIPSTLPQNGSAGGTAWPVVSFSMTGKDIPTLTGGVNLKYLYCYNNKIKNLNVSSLEILYLNCSNNQLTTLTFSNKPELATVVCSGNPLMTSLNVYNNPKLTALNITNNEKLATVNCYNNKLTGLNLTGTTKITSLSCYTNQIKALSLSGLTALITLRCNDNQLKALDVSANTALTSLYCQQNILKSLSVLKNTNIATVNCSDNLITSLSLPTAKPTSFSCTYNMLSAAATQTLITRFGSASVEPQNGETKISITFDFNATGGKSFTSDDYIKGGTYGLLPSVSLKGYRFLGWFSSLDGSLVTATSRVEFGKAGTLVAHWASSYPIYFGANGGKVKTLNKTVTINAKIGALPTPTRAGYSFTGWYTAAKGGTKISKKNIVTETMQTVYYAHWKAKTLKAKFKQSAKKTTTIKVKYDTKYGKLPKVGAAPAGKKFAGWYTKKKGGTKITAKSVVKIAKNSTIYPHWKGKTYKVTLKLTSKQAKTIKATYGKKYGKLPKPEAKGFKFLGWYTSTNGGAKITAKSIVKITKNTTLYPHWKSL
jgi:uncharacterized repeat protein (TIGR02543 family)